MPRQVRHLVLVSCAVALVVPIGGCMGSDESSNEDEIRDAREQGEKEGRDEARLRQLERELAKRERGGGGGGGSSGGGSSGGGSSGGGSSGGGSSGGSGTSGSRDCGGGLSANSNTSCTFARIVRDNYNDSPQGVVKAYSPVTNQSYTMYCTSGSPHRCSGGNNAEVFFP